MYESLEGKNNPATVECPRSIWISEYTKPVSSPQRVPYRYAMITMGSIPAMVMPPPKGKLKGGTGIREQTKEMAVARAIIMPDSVSLLTRFESFIFLPPKK
jgi:hypothetical protein